MAWIDDRIYCHPKLMRVSKPARWAYVAGVAYSAGWQTGGVLEPGALKAIHCERKHAAELLDAGLWKTEGLNMLIHDWQEHNGKRDARRQADRERKRAARRNGASAGHDADTTRTHAGQTCGPARVDGSEGSEEELRAVTALRPADDHDTSPDIEQPFGINISEVRAIT